MEQRIESVLDKTLGPPPLNVFLYGMDYTPKQLAESVALPGEWKAYTSFCHLPYYQDVRLSMYPDASLYAAHNLPLDSLLALVDRSLRNGHPVAWEGDMKKGHAAASLSEGQQQDSAAVIKEYAEQRKRLYRSNRLKPSQQHCILGLARHNGSGEKHYILKAYADGPARQTSKTATPQHTRKYSTAYMPLSTLLTATTVVMVKNRGEK